MLDVIIPVYLPMLQGVVGHVTVEGLWGEAQPARARWTAQRPLPTKWKLGGRAPRVVCED